MNALAPITEHRAAPTSVPMLISSRASVALQRLDHMETIPEGCWAQLEPDTGVYVVVDPSKRDMVDGATVALRWHEFGARPSISELRYYPKARMLPGWHVRSPFVPEGSLAMIDQIHPNSWEAHGVGHVIGVLANRDGTPMRDLWPRAHGYSDETIPAEVWPPFYLCKGDGDCLMPVFPDGTQFLFSSTETPVPGEFVGMWRKAELTGRGQHQCLIKRLVTPLPEGWDDPDQRYARMTPPLIIVEMLNPRRRFVVPLDDLTAVHKCLGESDLPGVRWSRAEASHQTRAAR